VRVPPGYLDAAGGDEEADADDPLARLCRPDPRELRPVPWLERDPLAEERLSPVPGLVHRYPDRALLLVTPRCAVYCRFCTRKRLVGRSDGPAFDLAAATDYLAAHPGIREVVVSGGDPLVLADERLAEILAALRALPSVEVLRLHTRVPAVQPARVTAALAATLARFHPLYVMIHVAHPRELTPAVVAACGRLADAGLPLGSQTVLLRGVNDDPDVLAELFRGLLRARVRPYYLHQCDLTEGIEHFRTPLDRGIALLEALRGRLSGTALPTFVVDLPGGLGKVPLGPEHVVAREPGGTRLRAPGGQTVVYPDPAPAR
jgi:lysine 2,3-aminomutase